MTNWRDVDPALAEVLVKLPDQGVLVISGEGGFVQFQRSGDAVTAEVGNESAGDEPRLRARDWVQVDSWSGLWRRSFDHPASGDAAAAIVAEVTYALRNVWGWRSLDGFRYQSWREVNKRVLGLFPKTEERPLSWPALGLSQRQEGERIDD